MHLFLPLLAPLIPSFFWAASSEVGKQIWILISLAFISLFLGITLWCKKKIEVHYRNTLMIYGALCVFVVTISMAFSESPYKSFFGSFDRLQGAATYFVYALWALIVWLSLDRDVLRYKVLFVTYVVGIVSSFHSIGQYFTGEIPGVFAHRVFAAMGNPTSLGQFLIFPFFAGIGLLETPRKKLAQYSLFVGILSIATALVLTGNRASLLGIVVGTLILSYKKQTTRTKKILISVAAILGFATAVIFINSGFRSLKTRLILWPQALQLIQEQPYLGSGNETYKVRALPALSKELYQYENLSSTADRPHNSILEAGVHRGILGIIVAVIPLLFLAFLIATNRPLTPRARVTFCALVAYTISIQFGFSVSTHTIFQILFWGILLYELPDFNFQKKIVTTSSLGLFFCTSGILCLVYGSILFRSAQRYEMALEHSTEPELFSKLLTSTPRYEEWYMIYFKLNYKAASKNPKDIVAVENILKDYTHVFGNELYVSIFEGYVAAAKKDAPTMNASFQKAIALAPNWPESKLMYADALRELEDPDGEKKVLKEYIDLAPRLWRWPSDKTEIELRPFDEPTEERIFRISNQGFYKALERYIELEKKN